jgi:hypothetical protein
MELFLRSSDFKFDPWLSSADLLTSKQASKDVPACLLAKVRVENLLACLLVGLQSLKIACYLLVCLI